MNRYCLNCGRAINPQSRFCSGCGAPVDTTGVGGHTYQHFAPYAPPKKKGKGLNILCIVLSLILVLQIVGVTMYGWPGYAVKTEDPSKLLGVSDIKLNKSDYNVPAASVEVGPENTVVSASNITVDFGEFNLVENETLKIKDLGVKEDTVNGYSARCYDFTMGDVSEFPMYVKISLPYEDIDEAAERFFIQYYNSESGSWEILYSELDETAKTVSFYTDHFSTFALFDCFDYIGGYNRGPLTKVVFSSQKLDDALSRAETNPELFFSTLQKKHPRDSGLIDAALKALGLAGNLVTASNTTVDIVSSVGSLSGNLASSLGSKLGTIGIGITALKVGLSWYDSGSLTTAFQKNKYDIAQIGLTFAGSSLGFTPLVVIAGGVWLVGMADTSMSSYLNFGYDSPVEHAYQDFTWNFVSHSKFANKFGCTLPNRMPARAHVEDMVDAKIMNEGHNWAWMLKDIYIANREDPKKLDSVIEKTFEEYASVFWKLKPSVRKMIAEDIHRADAWVEPSQAEIRQHKDKLKAQLRYRLRSIFACLYERSIIDAKTRLVREIQVLEKEFNTITSFDVYALDGNGKEVQLSKTAYKDYIAAFAKSPTDRPTIWSWMPGRSEGKPFQCTLYNYLSMGSPSCVKFYANWDDQISDKPAFTLNFTYDKHQVKLKIASEISLDDILGVWDMTYRMHGLQSGFTDMLVDTFGDEIIERGDYASTTLTFAGAMKIEKTGKDTASVEVVYRGSGQEEYCTYTATFKKGVLKMNLVSSSGSSGYSDESALYISEHLGNFSMSFLKVGSTVSTGGSIESGNFLLKSTIDYSGTMTHKLE